MNKIANLSLLFIGAQFLGLVAALCLIPATEVQVAQPIGGIWIFGIIAGCGFLALLLLKWKLQILIKIWLSAAVFFGIFFFFGSFFSLLLSAIGAAFLLSLRLWKKSVLILNFTSMLAFAGIGALLGVSLGFLPSLILLLTLAIYDFFSVKISGHMVSLAKKSIKSRIFPGFAYFPKGNVKIKKIPKEAKTEGGFLGGGDVVIPLTFSLSLIRKFGFIPSLLSIITSCIALVLLLWFSTRKPRFWPALPILGGAAIAGWLIGLIFIF